MNPKIMLIDGNNLSYMAHGRQVMTFHGERTEVLYLGLSMLSNNLKLFEPDRLVVVWDGGKDKRRKKICPEYKGHRRKDLTEQEKKEWELFFKQMDKLKEAFYQLGITQYYLPGREADDIIYNLVEWINQLAPGTKFVVMSTDKDFFQLLPNPNVFVYNPVKKIEYTRARFEHEFGFEPEHYVSWKAMVGDASDNLKGVSGLGPKKATKIVQNLFKERTGEGKIPDVPERDAKLLLDNFDEFTRMRETIEFYDIGRDELQAGKQKKELKSAGAMQDAMMQILSKYGFQRMIQRFPEFIAPFEQVFIKETKK